MKKIIVFLIRKFVAEGFILRTLESDENKGRKAAFGLVSTLDTKAVCKEIIKTL